VSLGLSRMVIGGMRILLLIDWSDQFSASCRRATRGFLGRAAAGDPSDGCVRLSQNRT